MSLVRSKCGLDLLPLSGILFSDDVTCKFRWILIQNISTNSCSYLYLSVTGRTLLDLSKIFNREATKFGLTLECGTEIYVLIVGIFQPALTQKLSSPAEVYYYLFRSRPGPHPVDGLKLLLLNTVRTFWLSQRHSSAVTLHLAFRRI